MPGPIDESPQSGNKPLAVVGLGMRYPGDVTDSEGFWKMMMERKCASSQIPSDRLNVKAHYHPDSSRHDGLSVDGGHFISGDLGAFDASFFSLPSAEAEGMDPQQRMILETSYHALENAGITLDGISGTQTCVFTGCSANDYATLYSKDPQTAGKYVAYGQSMNMIANRVSWFYNLKGPSVNVDTACSSGLVALDMACQSIWAGVSTAGLVVGANLIFAREFTNALDNLGVLSSANRCYTFDERASGHSRGEGIGALVIKSVEDAIRDGDTIRAVIRGTRSNQDGWTPGITQPNRKSQQALIEDCYRHAQLSPALTGYFEAHGTGTPTGDPIETRSIGTVFRPHRSEEDPLYVGSIKSNIGHLEGGSGVAGVMKVILALEKGVIPPISENYRSLNPSIDAEYLNLKVNTDSTKWRPGLRRASCNSFGFGGTNSHAILDDALNFAENQGLILNHNCAIEPSSDSISTYINGHSNGNDTNSHANGGHANGFSVSKSRSRLRILTWSSADKGGIERIAESWQEYLSSIPVDLASDQYFDDLTHTLNHRRSRLAWTAYALVDNTVDLAGVVDSWSNPIQNQGSRALAYVFSGQGAQWPSMGRELIARYSLFRQSLVKAGIFLRDLGCKWNLLDELQKDSTKSSINDPVLAQPLCTAIQIALVDLLSVFGLTPVAVVGHSSGEIAAAYCAGAISREYAWRLAYFRGYWAAKLPETSAMNGAMMAVALSSKEVEPYLNKIKADGETLRVSVACINGPESITLSGDRTQITCLDAWLKEDGIFSRILPIPVAYHSFQMEEIAASYRNSVGDDRQRLAEIRDDRGPRMVSSVTGTWAEYGSLQKADYWVKNLLSTVQFLDAFQKLCIKSTSTTKKIDGSHRAQLTVDLVVEIGPHAAMRGPCREILRECGRDSEVEYLSVLTRNACGVKTALDTMARLTCLGYPVNLKLVNTIDSEVSKTRPKVLVDLPPYEFDHSKSYWREGPVSKNFRFRRFGRHEMLGWPDDDWNPLVPKWNNFLQPSNPIWAKEHQINNTIILPGASMLSLAIEAMKQVTDSNLVVSGFNFKNVKFMSALVLPAETSGVHTRFIMSPQRDDGAENGGWFEFSLFSHNVSWIKHCTGTIQAVIDKEESNTPPEEDEYTISQFQKLKEGCSVPLDPKSFYESPQTAGLQFGPSFASILNIFTDQVDRLITEIKTYTTESTLNWNESYTIHPTTLDGLMQSTQVLRSQGGQKSIPTSIPSRLDRAWFSNGGLTSPEVSSIRVGTQLRHEGRKESTFNLIAVNQGEEKTLIKIEGVTFTAIDSSDNRSDSESSSQASTCHQIEWKPDINLMTAAELMRFLKSDAAKDPKQSIDYMTLELVIEGFIVYTLRLVNEGHKHKKVPLHMESYLEWMDLRLKKAQSGESPFSSQYWQMQIQDPTLFERLCQTVGNASQQGRLIVEIGTALLEGLSTDQEGKFTNLVAPEIIAASCQESIQAPGFQQWKTYVDSLAHKRPDLRLLEIDGTSMSVSDLLLTALTVKCPESRIISRFAQFDIATGSADELSRIKTRLGDCGSRVSFTALDLEVDFEPSAEFVQYDLIVVCLAFHRVSSLEKTLEKLRKMLAPGGKLTIIDVVNPSLARSGFVNGLDERWWINTEPCRKGGHFIQESEWDKILRDSGFTGCELLFRDYDDIISHEFGIIVSGIAENPIEAVAPKEPSIAFLLDPADQTQEILANSVCKHIAEQGATVDHWSVNFDIPEDIPKDLICVVTLELEIPVLAQMDKRIFEKLQILVSKCQKIIWVTSGEEDNQSPFLRVVDGFFRVLNSEDSRGVFTTLSMDKSVSHAENILKVIQSMAHDPVPETEYVVRNGFLHIPRFVEAPVISNTVARRQSSRYPARQQWNFGAPLRLSLGPAGTLDGLRFVEDENRELPLPADRIEIKVKAVGANFRDVLVALGRMDQSDIGFECAGIVSRVGKDCTKFQVGDHVAGCDFDTYSSYVRLQEAAAVKMPHGMSFAEAAAIPTNFCTAWHAFSFVANVQPGETVLVHSAAGGTGQAAVQVAQHLGATVFATVGNEQKKELLMEKYGIHENHIFSSRDTHFAAGIRRITNGRGVDVVLNSLSGDGLIASWECIAPYGRFVEMGKRDIMGHSQLDMYHFARNASFSAIDLAMITKERPHLIGSALRAVMPLISAGTLRISSPHRVYGIGELEQGLRTLQGGQSSGKAVFEMRDHDVVDTFVRPSQQFNFSPNATYILAGGLGGLGRNVARWMISHGARHLLLLSRSGANTQEAQAFIRELSSDNVQVIAPPCDITNRSLLEAVLGVVSCTMPPIRGCIQATMVLQDAMFEQMTYNQWVQATSPKIEGTWNLHQLLPQGLDFFVMISSISSIMGNRGQANYAAANGFMDALAHYRMAQGERASTLNMGFFLSAGAVAQSEALKKRYESNLPFVPVTEPELHALLSIYCDPSTPQVKKQGCQTILGLKSSSAVYKKNPDAFYWLQKPAFRQIYATDHADGAEGDYSDSTGSQTGRSLLSADSVEATAEIVMELLSIKLSKALGINKQELSGKKPMHSYGIDSLVAVELRNWFSKEMNVDIAIFDMLGGATMDAVVGLAAGKIFSKRSS